jgi:hypothetical protein
MCDKLVYDLSQEVEGSPNIFVRKDWLNILDNQNQNYNNNQSVVDTSQLSNSNKWMSYREAYFSVPFIVSLGTTNYVKLTTAVCPDDYFNPDTAVKSADYSLGLKNWFGQIIHSFTLDYNGTTIIQQTPYINIWNSFKLMTSLSLDDINTQGATIGFYPDDADTWTFTPAGILSSNGQGTSNNTNFDSVPVVQGAFNNFSSGGGNVGFLQRQQLINFDTVGSIGGGGATYASLLYGNNDTALKAVWKSYISTKINQANNVNGIIQFSIVGTIYLKHIHSFFNMCPLLKGVFMKMTMNLNNTSTSFYSYSITNVAGPQIPQGIMCQTVANPLGGINPLMLSSGSANNGANKLYGVATQVGAGISSTNIFYKMNISVGSRCLDTQLSAIPGATEGTLSKSIYLYIPAYTFNPVFEQAYLSSPIKQIKYTDVYQYQVLNVGPNSNFNNLLTNGIANIKSVLVIPFYSTAGNNATANTDNVVCNVNTGFLNGTPVFQSPFDPAGTGPTSPMCWLTNFNVQISGQNAIYNTQKYNFEQFNNQLYGQNAVNGGLTDGITSGLIDRQKFDMSYSYYYVNVERMLPVEMSVPKSVQILGQNLSSKYLDLYCFVEYGVEVSIDALSGARV